MKKFFLLLTSATLIGGALLLNSCSSLQGRDNKNVAVAANVPVTPPATKAPLLTTDCPVQATAPRSGQMTDAELDDVLSHVKIPQFIGAEPAERERNQWAFNGFFGKDRYRVEFYFATLDRDKTNGHVWHITGKTRYKKDIEPFKGDLIIDSATNKKSLTDDYSEYKQEKNITEKFSGDTFQNFVSLRGHFTLSQPATIADGGIFSGNLFADVTLYKNNKDKDEKYELWENPADSTRGAGWLMNGDWKSYDGKQQKELILANYLFAFGNDILKNFSYGDREIQINAKYRSLGWDNYWSDDEWWNDSNSLPVSVSGQ